VTGHALRNEVLARLRLAGFHALPFYPQFIDNDEPESGFAVWVSPPRFSQSYWATRNRFGALVETHSWQPYPRRVAATRETILAMVDLASRDGAKWLESARAADERARALAGTPVVLSYTNTDAVRTDRSSRPGDRREYAPAHWPGGGSQSSTLLPSGSMTQPNLPYSDSSVLSSTLQPSLRSSASRACRSATR